MRRKPAQGMQCYLLSAGMYQLTHRSFVQQAGKTYLLGTFVGMFITELNRTNRNDKTLYHFLH